MIIIHVITAFGIGGAEKLLLNVINKQVENNEVHLIYFKDKNYLINDLDARVITKQIPFSFSIINKLKKYYKTVKPDILHTHLGHADLLGIWSARNMSVKIFTTMHSTFFKKNWLDNIFFLLYRIIKFKIKDNWHIISISKSVEKQVLKKIKIDKKKSHLLNNAIPSKVSEKKIKTLAENNIINILFVGRLTKAKSIETLLEAIFLLKNEKLNKSFHLNIVGDGELRDKLESLCSKLQINNLVTFTGEIKKVNQYYLNSDIFVLPSIWEGFGMVILEAFRAKLAVIVSNIEGPAELIDDTVNGLMFQPKEKNKLAKKIAFLINNDDIRLKIAEKGFISFSEKYTIENYVKELNKLYVNV